MKTTSLFDRSRLSAWIVLTLSIGISIILWMSLKHYNEKAASRQFQTQAKELLDRISLRLSRHETILRGGAGFFNASSEVTRSEWHTYVNSLNLLISAPGIQGVGYSVLLKPADLQKHIAKVKREGFPNFSVRPPGIREMYTSIVYLEPFEGRNLAAFGFDMMSEATRRKAMHLAAETGHTSITGKVKLVQENQGKVQAGFLMYVPIYRKNAPLDTAEQRWQATAGFVYSPYRMDDLMQGTLGKRDLSDIFFTIHDGGNVNTDTLMYSSLEDDEIQSNQTAHFNFTHQLNAYNHTWTISIHNKASFITKYHPQVESIILLMSLAISLSLFALTNSLINRREHALTLAKNMTHNLKESEQRFHSIIESAGDAIYIHDRYGKILDINQVACDQTGYTHEELLKLLVPQLDVSFKDESLKKIWDMGEADPAKYPLTLESSHRRKDGSIFPIEVRISLLPKDTGFLFVAMVRDISERKQAEIIKQERNARIQAIVDTVIDGIITIDHLGIVETFNPSAKKIFGYEPEEVIGQNIKMLMPDPYHSEHDGYLHNYMSTGHAKIIGIGREVTGRRKDGSTFPMELAVSEMQVEGKRLFTGIVRDITERKRIDRMKNEFISTVSHELRTPLTAIRGSLGLITGGVLGALPEQVQTMLSIASNNTERLLMLINDILDIQKIEAGKMAFRFENVSLIALLEKAISDLSTYGDQHGVKFKLTRKLDDVHIYADRDRMMQVLANIMSNAAKFSSRDSTVEIAVARHHDGRLRISITDHGSGIPKAFEDKIFQPFTQSDSSDTRSKGGTGLGLAITKAIVEKHGGNISFVSHEGVGTTFYVELPEMVGGEQNATHQPRTLPQSHRACVLIVEDDPDVAALIRRMLTEAGYDSDIAYTAQQARQLLAERNNYRLMTLDIMLPDEDGMSLLESLRKDPATASLPVVVVSVKADEMKQQLLGGAMDVRDWLQKPIDSARLINVIKTSCGNCNLPSVLHVEDEADVRSIVASMLKDQCELSSADTIASARQALESKQFDLVLLDINLPDGSGLDLIDLIEKKMSTPRIVIFSATDVSEEYAHRVSGVLVKSKAGNEELLRIFQQSMKSA